MAFFLVIVIVVPHHVRNLYTPIRKFSVYEIFLQRKKANYGILFSNCNCGTISRVKSLQTYFSNTETKSCWKRLVLRLRLGSQIGQ